MRNKDFDMRLKRAECPVKVAEDRQRVMETG